MQGGWIKLHRKIYAHDLFQEERVFSKFEAWVDLIMLANYKDGKTLINSTWVEVKRGQRLTSMKKLGERWQWSNRKVKGFLDLLKKDGMLSYICTSKYTLVTIENYEFYQKRENDDAYQTHIKSTSDTHQIHTNKKEEERLRRGEERKEPLPPILIKGGRYGES